MLKIKICGITNLKDAQAAVAAGANALGFIFYKKSPRYVAPAQVKSIIEKLPPFITPVGVFVNQSSAEIKRICNQTGIQTIQLHGDETSAYCNQFKGFKLIKAFRIHDKFDFRILKKYVVDAYLFDAYQENAYGGTGQQFNWQVLKNKVFDKPFILSGGINPSNVAKATEQVKPFAIDVSSGLEKSPGIKDSKKIKAFFNQIKYNP